MVVAVVQVVGALVNILASVAISLPAVVARARGTSLEIVACRVNIAIAIVVGTLVDIRASDAVAEVAVVASA
jgi:hypothetical protein